MAREVSIPSTSTFVQDFGLNVVPPPSARNRRVVIMGTAEDGPMYEPILISKPEDAEFVWGRVGAGDLVRGIFECWGAQDGYPDVVGVRIGNGKNAILELAESTGSGQNTAQSTTTTALKLTARYPGQIYNNISIAYDENRNVSIYNPKTQLSTTISVDTERPTNTNVDVHNVSELVDSINSDRNLSSVLIASYDDLTADYEVMISGGSTTVLPKNDTTGVKIDIEALLEGGYITTNGFITTSPTGTGVTSSNNLTALETIEAVSISDYEDLENKGVVSTTLALSPLDGKGQSRWDTLQALKDYDADGLYLHDPEGSVVSEYVNSLKYALADSLPTASGGYISDGSPQNQIWITCPLCLDDSEETYTANVASGHIVGLSDPGELYANYSGDWTEATTQGIDTKLASDGTTYIRPSGLIKVYVSDNADINGFWQELPYSNVSGIYLAEYDATNDLAKFSIGSALTSSVEGVMRNLVDANGRILEDKFVRITANTTKGFLTEVESLPQLEDVGSTTLQTYFVRGQEILFNKAPTFDMIVNYGTRITYEQGANISISDPFNGEISFTDPDLLPGPAGGPLSLTKVTYLRLRYQYMPNWPNVTSAAKTLQGGTDGNVLTNNQRKTEFQTAYANLRNFEANLWVPMSAFIDATAQRFNPITGLKETISAGYHTDMEDFLEDLSINSIQPHAILGVTPMTEVTQVNKDTWVEDLTVLDITDPTRGSNIMAGIQNKFISVAAFEPVIPNVGRGSPYSTNGQAVYAGMLAALPYDISPTNKEIRGVYNQRFELSIRQYEALNSMRYVTMQTRPGRNPTIVNDVTAAPYGSDYTSWAVYSITAEAADRVKRVAQGFIGRPNSIPVRNSMDQQISNVLLSMSGLQAFDFSINSTINQQVLGIIEIDLILVPIFTIKKIRTTVKLRKNIQSSAI